MEEKFDQLLSNNIVRENDVSGSTFLFLRFLFASISYHYEDLYRTLQKKWAEGISNFYCCSASRIVSKIHSRIIPMDEDCIYTLFHRYSIPCYDGGNWNSEEEYFKETCDIVDGLKTELDKSNIGGDTYQATMVLEEVKISHEIMYTKLISISSNVNGRFVYYHPSFEKS